MVRLLPTVVRVRGLEQIQVGDGKDPDLPQMPPEDWQIRGCATTVSVGGVLALGSRQATPSSSGHHQAFASVPVESPSPAFALMRVAGFCHHSGMPECHGCLGGSPTRGSLARLRYSGGRSTGASCALPSRRSHRFS
jgi:hypothetical protein